MATTANVLKTIFVILLIIIAIFGYIKTRRIGCKDKKALNYDPHNSIDYNRAETCIYPTKGCMDKSAANYDLYANVSCTEDCDKWQNEVEKYISEYSSLSSGDKKTLLEKITIESLSLKLNKGLKLIKNSNFEYEISLADTQSVAFYKIFESFNFTKNNYCNK